MKGHWRVDLYPARLSSKSNQTIHKWAMYQYEIQLEPYSATIETDMAHLLNKKYSYLFLFPVKDFGSLLVIQFVEKYGLL